MYIGYIALQKSSRTVVSILSVINHQLPQRLTRLVDCILHEAVATCTNARLSSEICPTVIGSVVRILSVSILVSSSVTSSHNGTYS